MLTVCFFDRKGSVLNSTIFYFVTYVVDVLSKNKNYNDEYKGKNLKFLI